MAVIPHLFPPPVEVEGHQGLPTGVHLVRRGAESRERMRLPTVEMRLPRLLAATGRSLFILCWHLHHSG